MIQEEIEIVIGTLAKIGVPKDVTLSIMEELMDNASKYANNQEAIDLMLKEKLDDELYQKLKNITNE